MECVTAVTISGNVDMNLERVTDLSSRPHHTWRRPSLKLIDGPASVSHCHAREIYVTCQSHADWGMA